MPYTFALVILTGAESCSPPRKECRAKTEDSATSLLKTEILNIKIMTENEFSALAEQVSANIINCTKEVLTSDEAARYMGISKSYLYKLTMRQQIPHYKPMGKMCYFNRQELEQWLQGNRVSTQQEYIKRGGHYEYK